jgi:hypothetical protein
MDDLSVEVGHPNGAYYKVNIHTKKKTIYYKNNIHSFSRQLRLIWMKLVLMLNMIKSK